MADSFIQVAPDSTGKQMQTYLNTISAQPVHAEAVVLVDSTGTPLGTTSGALNVYVGSLTATVSGTVTANQGGTWNIGTLATITNPVTVAQSNASNLAATVSGTVAVNAGTNLNTSLLATNVGLVGGGQKTQIVDGAGSVIGSTANALNVYLASVTANSGTNLNTGNVRISVFQGAATLASGQVANVTNVSTTIAGARATRRSVTIRNQDLTNSGYVGPAPIGTANGILLRALESISVDFVGVVAGISATTSNVTFGYLETYD